MVSMSSKIFRYIRPKLEEEDEDTLLRLKAKLYRFDKDGNQWKERGDGFIKLLKHRETGKFRLVMRQSGTLKVIVNHLVPQTMLIQEDFMSRNSWFWHANDFSGGELKKEVFSARFESFQNAKLFKVMVLEAAESQVRKSEESKEEGARSLAAAIAGIPHFGEKKDASKIFQLSTAESPVMQKSEENNEGATSLAAAIAGMPYIGEKKDASKIFQLSTAESPVMKKSEESNEGATSLAAAIAGMPCIGEKKDASKIFQLSTAESPELPTAESPVMQKSEESNEGATALAACLIEKLYTEKKDVSNIYSLSTAESQAKKYEASKEDGATSLAVDFTEKLSKLLKEMIVEAAESQVPKYEASKEGATSLAAYLTEKLYIEKKDVSNIFPFSTAESQVMQRSEANKEGDTSLAAYLTEKLYSGENKDVYNIFQFSTAEKTGESINC